MVTSYIGADADGIQYQQLTLQVSNAQAGQNLGVRLQDIDVPIVYSTGQNFQTYSGISLATSPGGNLPLTSFSINPQQIQVQTQSGGGSTGSLTFTIITYLAAQPGISSFALSLTASAPGVQVTAQVGTQAPRAVDTTPTPFFWKPM